MVELPISVPPLEARAYDLILKGGHVIDPKRGLSMRMDVAIVGQSVLYMANLPLEANVLAL